MKKTERIFTNPFSENFIITWDLWKEFRKEEHAFSYKGVISEQMAINRLVEVSEGEEEKAVRIVHQSISRCWMDFYKLKQPKNGNNGESGEKQPNPKNPIKPEPVGVREQAVQEFMSRNGGGEQQGNSDHLKAV